jgi:2,3-bisphosphoglycerate-independent phosphoglycerate mutase
MSIAQLIKEKFMQKKRPLLLLIFDGWGEGQASSDNAIENASTPCWDYLWKHYPHGLIEASGRAVGLPEGQMGNSEVGHLHIGAGQEVPQDLVRIDEDIKNKSFFENSALKKTIEYVKQHKKALHIMGLLSPGGVHSHEKHLFALIEMAAKAGVSSIYLHAFLDGRDTPPQSALASIQKTEALFKTLGVGKIASISGRYYAMDRDQNWERTELVYHMLVNGEAKFKASSAEIGLKNAYERGEKDEFVKPTLIAEGLKLEEDDAITFMNFRADRARQLSIALTDANFKHFSRKVFPKLSYFVTLTQYSESIKAKVAYLPLKLKNTLAECLSKAGCRQLHIAETEKYAHVTFFFNGGREEPYAGEERILVPSPKVATYDLQPEMSAKPLTEKLIEAIASEQYDFIVCNYANPDMVGHTGDFKAAVRAIEVMDQCLSKTIKALEKVGGAAFITADHGNAECMFNSESKQAHTAHTTNPVPFIYTSQDVKVVPDHKAVLYDVAPTLLTLLDLKIPQEMTGHSLLFSRF